MSLKKELESQITASLRLSETQSRKYRRALKTLADTDLGNAEYSVELSSVWESEGEKSTHTATRGSLVDAIANAEKEFKETNRRTDIQAEYTIKIILNGVSVPVPEELWKKYSRRSA